MPQKNPTLQVDWVCGMWRYNPEGFRKMVEEAFGLLPGENFRELPDIGAISGIMQISLSCVNMQK
ncbi:hypothetical protein M422DRAFT_260796 [Sphaerobolus stellatus SS14]|uniref:Uncharacterized protein n=1 Tax=Sphaerobolus stellatus (strain SS14) TaxID=990650 RepID=A0A0C9VH70_SPHS4|nr:hypothetical protein M422DRAFT_260796 [Sphaerobolus stellatus SS14]